MECTLTRILLNDNRYKPMILLRRRIKLTVKMLLEDGRFYPNAADVLERTPLHMAVLQRSFK
jgi:ankyrin repeat protein